MISCEHNASATHIYGCYEIAGKPRDFPMNEVSLCDACGKDLFNRIKDSVANLHMHYEVKPISKN